MSENYDQSDHIEPPIATLDQEFSNRDVLISTIKQYFYARNEVVVLDKHSDQRKVTFKCYFGGQYRNGLNLTDNTRKRQTGSRLMACRFSIRKKRVIVGDLASSGTGAASTLAYLQDKTENQWTTRKERYNDKVVARAEFLDGRSPIQALYNKIRAGDFILNVMVDSNGALSGLFFCHEKSAELARRFNIVFIMDCTYKTNRFGMPLFNIVVITATYNTFNAGFAVICNETESMLYRELALVAALDIVFPFANNLLLRMACQQNILSNATKKFDDICDTDDSINDWSQLLSTVLASKHLKTDGLRFKSNGSQKQNHFGSVCARILGLIHK
ncbi:hypothetical protein BASA60_005676 [Batrachochytrium salamandrivorans]|nr:hypothetical protein BASA60_005676 [Batrachochytrium salamandrivorans]